MRSCGRRRILFALALLLACPRSASAGDPTRMWRTIETEHFRIHYHTEIGRLAQRLAVVAEYTHRVVAKILDHSPRWKVEVVISDETDDSNGMATVLPYAHVYLYATAPDDRSELNDYDDWLFALFVHEYTHIVHLDTIHGIARVVNWVFGFGERGHLYAPNQSQARFVVEGLAVFEETARASGGRLRSSIYDMYLRTAALEGKLQRIDQFTNSPIQWPRGASPYLYGGVLTKFIAERYGEDVLRKNSHAYGGTWIPWSMNRVLKRIIGKTFVELYAELRVWMTDHYRAQQAAIRASGETPTRVLTGPREYAARPTFTRDGREVVWADADGYSRPQLRRIAVETASTAKTKMPRPRTFHLVDGAGGSVFSPDGRTLYFNALEFHRTVYVFNDIFALDVASGKQRRMTHGLRAAEPDLSPDGKQLAFVVNEAGSRSLALMPAAGGPLTRLLGNLDDLSQAYTPSWSPDGRHIAFSWWRDKGYRDIWIIDAVTRELQRITVDRALDIDPRWSPDGKYIYFSSDRSGVYNLYAWEVSNQRTWQVTNVTGGAFDVAISPDGKRAVYVGFQADGWRLEAIDLEPSSWRPAVGALLDRPDAAAPAGEAQLPSRTYQPWRSAWPRTWFFSSYPDSFGQVVALKLSGSDIIGFHNWSLQVGFNFGRADAISAIATYTYTRLFPSFSFSASRNLTRRGGLEIDGLERSFVEDDYSASATMSLPIVRHLDQSSDLSVGYNFAYLRDTGDVEIPLNPNHIMPERPETGLFSSLGLSWGWSNTRRFTYSVSTEMGRSFGLSLGLSLRALGSSRNVYTASWRYNEYIPLGRSHVLALGYGGGISGGDVKHRSMFYLGGYASQSDPLRAAFDFTRPGGATLRGYPFASVRGSQFHVVNLEYRFPIAWIERGYATAPFYFRRLHGAAFVDCGNAMSDGFDWSELRVGIGAELRLEMILGYFLPAALQLGYAHGFMTGGDHQVYFYLNNPF